MDVEWEESLSIRTHISLINYVRTQFRENFMFDAFYIYGNPNNNNRRSGPVCITPLAGNTTMVRDGNIFAIIIE